MFFMLPCIWETALTMFDLPTAIPPNRTKPLCQLQPRLLFQWHWLSGDISNFRPLQDTTFVLLFEMCSSASSHEADQAVGQLVSVTAWDP